MDHDIALIVIDDTQSLPADYIVATIPDHVTIASGCCEDDEMLTTIGYGRDDDYEQGGTPTDTLERSSMEYHPMDECLDLINDYFNPYYSWSTPLQNDHICAMGDDTDVCSGDSGGPLFRTNNEGTVEVVGVTSYGYGYAEDSCNSEHPHGTGETLPSFFQSVAHNKGWINTVINAYDASWSVSRTDSPQNGASANTTEDSYTALISEDNYAVGIALGCVVGICFCGLCGCFLVKMCKSEETGDGDENGGSQPVVAQAAVPMMKVVNQPQHIPIQQQFVGGPSEGNIVDNQKEAERVRFWMATAVQLPVYSKVLIDNGFDSMHIIKSITMGDLEGLGITKMGHQKKIMEEVGKLNRAPEFVHPGLMSGYAVQENAMQPAPGAPGYPPAAQQPAFYYVTEQ